MRTAWRCSLPCNYFSRHVERSVLSCHIYKAVDTSSEMGVQGAVNHRELCGLGAEMTPGRFRSGCSYLKTSPCSPDFDLGLNHPEMVPAAEKPSFPGDGAWFCWDWGNKRSICSPRTRELERDAALCFSLGQGTHGSLKIVLSSLLWEWGG